MSKKVYKYEDIKEDIINAVDTIANPVRGTLSPKGRNVICQDNGGNIFVTNDGVTIAKSIESSNPVQNAIIEIVKHSALKTNAEAGDGTTTSILLSQLLIKEGLKLVDDGWNPITLTKELTKFGEVIKEYIDSVVLKIKNDKDIENVATISANGDKDIAKDIVEIVKFAGQDGMIFIEDNDKPETKITEDAGFFISAGMFSKDLRTHRTKITASYRDVPVFITDKRLYYEKEALTIMTAAKSIGSDTVVIIAKDFIGDAINFFTANHVQNKMNVLLVKDPNVDKGSLDDLAIYLGGKVISEKTGSIVDNITPKDFVYAEKVYADMGKTLIVSGKKLNEDLLLKVVALKEEKENTTDESEKKELERRLAALTNGMITVKVGGNTPIETREKIFKYEDAINATRAAMKDGYLVGGGLALYNSFDPTKVHIDLIPLFEKYTHASIKQIANNCNEHYPTVLENVNNKIGYNALTGKYEDLLKAGVIDPYKVVEMSVLNSISVANVIISSNYIVVNEPDEDESNK